MEQNLQIVNYNLTDAVIGEMAANYMKLQIMGLEDRDGFKAVRSARLIVKAHRCNVERLRKELKADALEWGRRVDAEAKRITALLEPIESHLEAEESRIEAEKETIRLAEEERKEAERIEKVRQIMSRVAAMANVGVDLSPEDVENLSEEEFRGQLAEATDAHETRLQIERERAEKEAAERKAEEERLEAERRAAREETERAQAEQKAENERLAKELAALKAEKAAADAAKRAEEERIALEQEAERKRQAEINEQLKAAAQAPDLEKLTAWARRVMDVVEGGSGIEDMEVALRLHEMAVQIRDILRGVL